MPLRCRLALAFILALFLLPIVPVAPALGAGAGEWLLLAVRELSVGLALGIVARATFTGIEGASRLIAGQSGFALASMIDPVTGAQSVTPALFHALLTTTLILAANLHHIFLRALVYSYSIITPAAALPATSGLQEVVVSAGTRLFGIGVVLAAPALVATFSVDLMLVLVGRAFPQVPVLMVGYPIKVAAGLVALVILTAATGSAIGWIGKTFAADGMKVLAALGAS
jgi:flagellar biosynthetic protein FliR